MKFITLWNLSIGSYLLKIIFIYRSNLERMEKFGKTLSVRSRNYREKRIDVNVKINALAYSAEVLGGIIIVCLSTIPHANVMYTSTIFWYGNVIPSCYLINSSDMKTFIMEQGWVRAALKLYKKKEPKDRPSSARDRNLERKRTKNVTDTSRGVPGDYSQNHCRGEENKKKQNCTASNVNKNQQNGDCNILNGPKRRLGRELKLGKLLEEFSGKTFAGETTKPRSYLNNAIGTLHGSINTEMDVRTPAVFFINNESNINVQSAVNNSEIRFILPNQPDYH